MPFVNIDFCAFMRYLKFKYPDHFYFAVGLSEGSRIICNYLTRFIDIGDNLLHGATVLSPHVNIMKFVLNIHKNKNLENVFMNDIKEKIIIPNKKLFESPKGKFLDLDYEECLNAT